MKNIIAIYDDVKLNTELEELAAKGIHKGCAGIVFEVIMDHCFVLFLNKKNCGDYACVNINKKYLDFDEKNSESQINEFEKIKATRDLTKDRFKINPFNEFDWVEILVEKEEYAKEGLHKGMHANVAFDYAYNDMLPVIFPDDEGYDVEVQVHLDDMKLCDGQRR